METKMDQPEELLFGLDIGTRNVVGLIAKKEKNDTYTILAGAIKEHSSRSMIDGQIHDIIQVSETIRYIKEELELQLERPLRSVAIAAAGRVLKTKSVEIEERLQEERTITKQDIHALEIKGVEQAQGLLMEELKQEDADYYCVGYSIIQYLLGGYMIENLEGHKGRSIGANILATFLPQVVVDSLYTAVERAGLEVVHLSLEPIAAINVAIPKDFRLLNLALVDIGAGTSDIAITREGAVVAYGMIPIAGDEITEQILHKYLVDFQTAEKIKKSIGKEDKIIFKDIIGLTHEIPDSEVLELIDPILNQLAREIGGRITELNGGSSPNAVFCIGGGGQIPGFIEKLEKELNMPSQRVVLRGLDAVHNVEYSQIEFNELEGSALITPIGICITGLEEQGENFVEVTLNGEKIRLLKSKELTIIDAAVKLGYDHRNLLSRKGKNLSYYLNGKHKRILGKLGISAKLTVNDREVSLDYRIQEGDRIQIQPAKHGADAKVTIEEILSELPIKKIILTNEEKELKRIIRVNGIFKELDYIIQNNDEVNIEYRDILQDVLKDQSFQYNGKNIEVNGELAEKNRKLENGDEVVFKEVETLESEENTINEIKSSTIVYVNNAPIALQGKKDYIFVDIFEYIDFDLKNPKGNIVLLLNGKKAAYTDSLKLNDHIEIYWDKKNNEGST